MPDLRRRHLLVGGTALAVAGCGVVSEARVTPGAWTVDLSDLEARHGGRIGLEAWDWNRVSWRAHERFLYASTFKLFLAAAFLAMAQREPGLLNHRVPVTREDIVFHAPVTEGLVGSQASIEQLCRAAVQVSDNPAANILLRELGGLEAMAAWYRSIGDEVTRVDRWETALNGPDGDRDTTTPFQTAGNIGVLFLGPEPRLGTFSRDLIEGWMIASPTAAGRIRAGVPQGWTGATKTGTSGSGHANDIGLLRPPSGDPVRIAIYYEAPEATSGPEMDVVIAEATRRALETLGHG